MPLNADDFKRLVEILAGWPGWKLERDRLDFMMEALRPSPRGRDILGQFDLSGNPHGSAGRAVSRLDQFGEDVPGREVTCLLIAALRPKVGRREQAELDAIAGRLNCPVSNNTPSSEQDNDAEQEGGDASPPDVDHKPPDPEPDKLGTENHRTSEVKKPRNWTIPVILGLLLACIGSAAGVLALIPESQRGDLFKTLFPIAASATKTATIATPDRVPTIALTASPLPPCPEGTGPNGIRAGNYNPYRLTDEERHWMWQAWGFEGEPDESWGGMPCGTDYGSPDLNFFAMVCERGNVGPEGYVPGGYDPQSLSQPVRQFLWDEFREGGGEGGEIAPVGYGGQRCLSSP